jgi:hypothetical protein
VCIEPAGLPPEHTLSEQRGLRFSADTSGVLVSGCRGPNKEDVSIFIPWSNVRYAVLAEDGDACSPSSKS